MIYLTDWGKFWAILVFTLSTVQAVICLAIAMLVFFQRASDTKSRTFAFLVLNIGLLGIMTCIMDAVGRFDPHHVIPFVAMAGVFLAAMPYCTFTFAVEFLDTWTPFRRTIAKLFAVYLAGVVFIVVLSIVAFPNLLFTTASYPPDGTFDTDFTFLTIVIIALGELGYIYTASVLWKAYRKKVYAENQWFFRGLAVIVVSGLSYMLPVSAKYSIGTNLLTIGTLFLVGPVLRQRLFDPLAELTAKVERRAHQLEAITHVDQQATSLLSLDSLLQAVAKEIRERFNYDGVAVSLLDKADQGTMDTCVVAGTFADGLSVGSQRSNPLNRVGIERWQPQVVELGQRPHGPCRAVIPLVTGTPTTNEQGLIGALEIESGQANAFGPEVLEVVQILANQIAIAIHNAQLFEEIQEARQKADDASASKTQFISTLSHEIRTPLQMVIAHADFLQMPDFHDNVPLPEVYIREVETIRGQARHLLDMVSDVLDLNKMEAGKFDLTIKPVNPVGLLQQVQQSSERLVQSGVQMLAKYADDLPYVLADETRIRQVLGNLVSNACKFTKEGQITLEAHVRDSYMCFSVTDTGPGIPDDARSKLFQPFAQASKEIAHKYGGSGMGLVICKRLVELHNGNIWFGDNDGQGTTFSFTLPLAPQVS